jgi:hypothetical protein
MHMHTHADLSASVYASDLRDGEVCLSQYTLMRMSALHASHLPRVYSLRFSFISLSIRTERVHVCASGGLHAYRSVCESVRSGGRHARTEVRALWIHDRGPCIMDLCASLFAVEMHVTSLVNFLQSPHDLHKNRRRSQRGQ